MSARPSGASLRRLSTAEPSQNAGRYINGIDTERGHSIVGLCTYGVMAVIDQPSSVASPANREPELDGVLSALAHHRRRYVVHDLVQRFRPVPLYDLAARLSTWEADGAAIDETLEEVRSDLLENHLPPMREAGLVEVSEDERLALTDRGMRAERVRRACTEILSD